MEKIIYYGNEKRILIKKYGKWRVTLSINNHGYNYKDLMIDDECNSYFMNDRKVFDNFYPIPV